jgi:prohibitin 2
VAIAEAEATALRAKADGEAYANLKVATAQADALRIQNAALAQNKDVLELRRIEVERRRPRSGTAHCRRRSTRALRSRS